MGACFLSPLPITDLKPCTLRGPALGMDIDIVDPTGLPVAAGRGARVPTALARDDARIWGDPEQYLDTYWRRFPGTWLHGDWATRDGTDSGSSTGAPTTPCPSPGSVSDRRRWRARWPPTRRRSPPPSACHIRSRAKRSGVSWWFGPVRPMQVSGQGPPQRGGRPSRPLVPALQGRLRPGAPKTRSAKIVRRAIRRPPSARTPGIYRVWRTVACWTSSGRRSRELGAEFPSVQPLCRHADPEPSFKKRCFRTHPGIRLLGPDARA